MDTDKKLLDVDVDVDKKLLDVDVDVEDVDEDRRWWMWIRSCWMWM